MKKAVMLVTLVVTMALSAMCFAAGDGSVLNKQQRVVDKFVAAVNTADSSGFAQMSADLAPDLQSKITAADFAAMQKQLKEKFGTQKELTFAAYERFDQGDRLTYLASYSKQKLVRAVYVFDKAGKMTEFVFVPVEIKAENK
ncbi:hypothetical protein [Phascolarctobacterium faecium]|uniref:hypothetical protein n=1 Tax=Phascolarctobacterium faecium TaxID=33025 RepID=UPI003AB817E4